MPCLCKKPHQTVRETRRKKKSQVLVGNKCALGLPGKAYRRNKTKGILEKEKRQTCNSESIILFPSPLILGVEQR